MAVVDGTEWERLKRYNVNELYREAFAEKGIDEVVEAASTSRVQKSRSRGDGE